MSRTCWARGLGECSEKMSREHYVSAALFDDAQITVQGFAWCREAPVTIGLASATAKILCSKHNSDLSPVDVAGAAAFRKLAEFHRLHSVRQGLAPRRWAVRSAVVDGFGLERWFAKTAVNLATLHATPLRWPSGASIQEPPIEYLGAIFGRAQMPPDAGLYMVARVSGKVHAGATVMFAPLVRGDAMYGGLFTFYGHRFLLSFIGEPVPSDLSWQLFDDWHGAQIARRMTTFEANIGGQPSHRLKFDWGTGNDLRALS